MDVYGGFWEFVSKNGLVGTLLLLFVLDKLKVLDKIKKFRGKVEIHPHRRVGDTEDIVFLHRREKDDLMELKSDFEKHLKEWGQHKSDEEKENIKMGIMETKLENAEKNQERLEDNDGKIFAMITALKDFMLEKGYGKKGR